MSCDISKIFLSIVRALSASDSVTQFGGNSASSTETAISCKSLKPDVFSARARGLFAEMKIVQQHITKANSLSLVLVSHDAVRQTLYHELAKQIVDALDKCSTLLNQLRQFSRLSSAKNSDRNVVSQSQEHQLVVCKLLEENLNLLKRQRDEQVEKYCRRLKLTGDLGSVFSARDPVLAVQRDTSLTVVRKRHHNWFSSNPTVSSAEAVSSADLTNDELQLLETENAEIYLRFLSDRSEIRDLGTSISEIGRLQSMISNSLVEQAEKAERIGDQIIGSTEDIKTGNVKLREAMDRTMGKRFWIVFIMLVLTFSIHFLDWYQ